MNDSMYDRSSRSDRLRKIQVTAQIAAKPTPAVSITFAPTADESLMNQIHNIAVHNGVAAFWLSFYYIAEIVSHCLCKKSEYYISKTPCTLFRFEV